MFSRRKIAPPPMKPTPVRMPSGSRMRSFITKESAARPAVGSSRLTWIIEADAARHTSKVVRIPAALPCSLRSYPITTAARIVSNSRTAISVHERDVAMPDMAFERHDMLAVPARRGTGWRGHGCVHMDDDRTSAPGGTLFGRVDERGARLFVIENDMLRARITDYGGVLVSLELRTRSGGWEHVVLGFDDVSGYVANRGSFGALLGRDANRIADGSFTVEGRRYELSKNENGSTLHGGAVGFDKLFWSIAAADPEHLVLQLTSADGDQGFPGEVEVTATYRLEGAALRLTFDAQTTRPTPLSLSAHPYFNLDGPGARDCLDHRIEIFASSYLPTSERQIPTGERRAVAGTVFDFSTPQPIAARIRQPDEQLRYGRGYDHYFILPEDGLGRLRLAARAYATVGDRVLEILTTQHGLQFYSGNNLNGSALGRGGAYRQSAGFAFEPQGFPNAVNQPNFPTTILRPGERYHEEIVYRFPPREKRAAP
jgi:aldose 1-epimerase